jgi:hypothetical protein
MSDLEVGLDFASRKVVFFSIGVLACVTLAALPIHLTVRNAAIQSYLQSVGQAVQAFQIQHGHYPTELGKIDRSQLDYDSGIPFESLKYELDESEWRVSYKTIFGKELYCSRQRNDNDR